MEMNATRLWCLVIVKFVLCMYTSTRNTDEKKKKHKIDEYLHVSEESCKCVKGNRSKIYVNCVMCIYCIEYSIYRYGYRCLYQQNDPRMVEKKCDVLVWNQQNMHKCVECYGATVLCVLCHWFFFFSFIFHFESM